MALRGTTGTSMGGGTFRVPEFKRELNKAFCEICSAAKGRPCRPVKRGGPEFLDKTHSTAAEPNWKKQERQQVRERSAEVKQFSAPGAFVPRNLRNAAVDENGKLRSTPRKNKRK